jgi:hypothetical protein
MTLFAMLGVACASFVACSSSSSPSFSVPAPCTGGATGGQGGGTVDGDGVSATLCATANVGLHTFVSRPQLLFQLSGGKSTFQSPAGASNAELFGSLGITGAKPGTYASSDPSACGTLSFVYALASPPGLDCNSTPTSPSDADAHLRDEGRARPDEESTSLPAGDVHDSRYAGREHGG